MTPEEFRQHGHEVIDWLADYLRDVERLPVRAQVVPGQVRRALPDQAPVQGEPMSTILADFERVILPGITHWNHPRFFAYFPANQSGPSILGELLAAGLGVNAMLWQTSPAATELEQVVLDWLRQLVGLPGEFTGALQDSASTSTLTALLCARERRTGGEVARRGFPAGSEGGALRVYCSTEAHSSVDKGARLAGFGDEHVIHLATDAEGRLDPAALERQLLADQAAGLRPCALVATVGTTSTTAIDPLRPLGELARRHGLWLHVDAALAGSAAILPEYRWIFDGIEAADSLVFNPHKWLFTNFDCSAFYTRDPVTLTTTMSVTPEYLKTDQDRQVVNYRDRGIQLGRRFRALKLWFVLRNFGVEGLQQRLRLHLALARELQGWIDDDPAFERLAPVPLNTICFRWHPPVAPAGGEAPDEATLERLNRELEEAVNASGVLFFSHTRVGGRYALRLCVGQTETRREHVVQAWSTIRQLADRLAAAGR